MRHLVYILILLCLPLGESLAQQRRPLRGDAGTDARPPSERPVRGDTNDNKTDTVPPLPTSTRMYDVAYSKDSLESKVDYHSRDSMMLDPINGKIYLYGAAEVRYEGMELKAGHIILDQINSTVTAEGIPDSTGQMVELPEFKDGEQAFKAGRMKYNFKTEKGIIYDAKTQQNDMYVHSGVTKYSGKFQDDSLRHDHDDVIFSSHSIFTTCNHDEPHFGIRSNKQKVVTDKVIVVGPSNLEIAGVPTPLWLPFGFFPLKKGQRSGLLFPKNYENSRNLGFGLKNVGYYWGINDNYDLQLTGDIYTRGTWQARSLFRYKRRYKFEGSLDLSYGWVNQGEIEGSLEKDITKVLGVRWDFRQATQAHPTRKFNANVNFQLNQGQQLLNNDAQSVQNNQLSSTVGFSKTFPGKPFNLTANIGHSQNTRTSQITITAPDLRFTMNRVYPFKRKVRTGKEQWYEKIGVDYKFRALGRFEATDTTLFTQQTLEDFQYGLQHSTSTNPSFRILKYFNLTPSVTYSENWMFSTINKEYVTTTTVDIDTLVSPAGDTTFVENVTESSEVVSTDVHGFKPLRQFRAGINIGTDVYSTLQFKKGRFKGIRYTMRPSVGFAYEPDYTNEQWGYFDTYERGEETVRYSVFEGNVLGANAPSSGMKMNLEYGIRHIFEAKYLSRKDSINPEKRVKLFDNLSMGGNYNFAADSLHFSPLGINGTARLFKRITTVTLSASFDPYAVNDEGRRINTFHYTEQGKLLRFDFLNTRINTNIGWQQIKEWFGIGKKDKDKNGTDNPTSNQPPTGQDTPRGGTPGQVPVPSGDANAPLLSNISLRHIFNIRTTAEGTEITSNSLSLQGSVNLSPKWQITLGGIGYDFRSKALTYPDISFGRNLHCWQMGLAWQPDRGAYSFYLRVNPGSLDFINIPWNKNQYDTGFGRF